MKKGLSLRHKVGKGEGGVGARLEQGECSGWDAERVMMGSREIGAGGAFVGWLQGGGGQATRKGCPVEWWER